MRQASKPNSPCVGINRDTYDTLSTIARQQDRYMSSIVDDALREYFERHGLKPQRGKGWKRGKAAKVRA